MPSSVLPPAGAGAVSRRRRRRRILRWAGGILLAGLVAAVALPWWFGSALGWFTPLRGFDFGRYERVGYARFALHELSFDRGGVRVRLDRAEADTPLLWLWRRVTGASSPVAGGAWEVTVAPNPVPATPARPRGWLPLRDRLVRTADQLSTWLRMAEVGAGRVTWPGGTLTVGTASWRDRTLTVERLGGAGLMGEAKLAFGAGGDVVQLAASDPAAKLTVALESRANRIGGQLRWHDQPAMLDARFPDRGWLPDSATLTTEAWRLPASAARLDRHYEIIEGRGRINWDNGRLAADVDARGTPRSNGVAPPLEVRLRGEGEATAFQVAQFEVQLPGATARLDRPVTIGRDGRMEGGDAEFAVTADLARLPWGSMAGRIGGTARLVSTGLARPTVDFALQAQAVEAGRWKVAGAEARGRFDWPNLQVIRAELIPAAGERVEAAGTWNFSAKEIAGGTFTATLTPAAFVPWLPAGFGFDRVAFTGRIEGPVAALRHAGSASAQGVSVPAWKPLAAGVEWEGRGGDLSRIAVRAAAGDSQVELAGAFAPGQVRVERFTLVQAGNPRLELVAPTLIRWVSGLALDPTELRTGEGGRISLRFAGGPAGEVALQADTFSSLWLQDLLVLPGPAWTLEKLALDGRWDRGPLQGSLELSGRVFLGEDQSVALAVQASSDADGWRFDRLSASDNGSTVVDATGRIGIAVRLDETPFFRLGPDAPLDFSLAAGPNAGFWEQIRTLSGVELQEPRASARVTGTWSKPQGELQVRAARLAFEAQKFPRPLPLVEQLDLEASADGGGIRVRRLGLQVEGQTANLTARLLLRDGGWPELWRAPLAVLRRGGEGEIEVPAADLARLARLAPEYLAPQGRLTAKLRVLPGGDLDGWLEVADAASRPLGPLGAFRDVNVRVALAGSTLRVETARAQLGGQPVALQGAISLPDGAPLRYDLALAAENVPLVRQSGLLLRGDLDLRLETDAGQAPRLSGTVNLRDSLFLSDLRALVERGPRGARRAPPYFAVENPGLRDWQLAVAIRGDRFLRVRTALFNGTASAGLELRGTLGAPWATGEMTVAEGRLLLPFATFVVQRGRVTLGAANPEEPQLEVTGTARSHGHDLRLEVAGPASDPILQFSSSPPLSSEQILLLVMTGEFPRPESATARRPRYASLGTFLGQGLLHNVSGGRVDPERLTVEVGGDVSRLGRETYAVEYELNRRLSVLGEYDEFDSFNAGLRWRLFSRGGTESDVRK